MHVFPAARLPQWCAGLTAKSSSLSTGFDERLFTWPDPVLCTSAYESLVW